MNILVVDDQSYNRQLLSYVLNDAGHETIHAENGRIACEIFKNNEAVDLILMDINMPEMDGIEATNIIKAECGNRFIPVIFVTALDDSNVISACLESGGDDFLPKPIVEEVLIAKINAHGRSLNLYNSLAEANRELELHKNMLDRELSIVERVFSKVEGRIDTYCGNISRHTSSTSMFNGDILLEAPSPSGGVYVLVGDFTGHGLAASIGTLPVSEIFFNFAAKQASVSQIVEEMNARLNELLPSSMFFCLTLAYVNQAGSSISLWSGGMSDALFMPNGYGEVELIPSDHLAMGILSPDKFDNSIRVINITRQSRFVIYTDGVTEAENPKGEQFGMQRLVDLVSAKGGDLVDRIVAEIHDFHEGEEQCDDLTVLAIRGGPLVHYLKRTNQVSELGVSYQESEIFPWEMKMRFVGDELKNADVVAEVLGFVSNIKGIYHHQENIFTIISELYSNSLEHGILRLDSAIKKTADGFDNYYELREKRLNEVEDHYIELKLTYIKSLPSCLVITQSDSGKGFSYAKVKKRLQNDESSYGRGLLLLDSICTSLKYSEHGRKVTATYEF